MCKGYPRLTPEMVHLAPIYAATNPLRGRSPRHPGATRRRRIAPAHADDDRGDSDQGMHCPDRFCALGLDYRSL